MESSWAFLDENNIVIQICVGDLNTMEFTPPMPSHSLMVKCVEERGTPQIGMYWNWELNKFE